MSTVDISLKNKIVIGTICNVIFKSQTVICPEEHINNIYFSNIRKIIKNNNDLKFSELFKYCLFSATNLIKPLIESYGNRHFIDSVQQKKVWNEMYEENNTTMFGLIVILFKLPDKLKTVKLEIATINLKIYDYDDIKKNKYICCYCNNHSNKKSVCGLKFCSNECQNNNWNNHKKICKICIDENKRVKKIKLLNNTVNYT